MNSLRLRWIMLTRGLGYSASLTEQVYHKYLNHHKVIHYRDGLPVYSLSSPALFSKPMANFVSQTFYGILQNRRFPNMMSFAVHDGCDLKCGHCSFFDGVADATRKLMCADECMRLVRDAQSLGVSVISFTGGEPLMREDICRIISSVDKNLSTTLMFTNGSLLRDKARELRKSGLDSVYVSIDSADKDRHDALRGVAGSFERAVSGLKAAKASGMSVGISTCVFPDALADGSVGSIIRLGKELGIHELLIFCATPSGRMKDRADLIDNEKWIDDLIAFTEKFRDDGSYPGILAYSYNSSHRAIGCSGGSRWFYVSPYGDISPCDFNHYVFGNFRATPLWKIWEEMSETEPFNCSTWGGCKLRKSSYRNGKHAIYFKP